MKRARRILSMLLAVLMIVTSAVVTTVSAEDTAVAEDHGTQPTTWWNENVATAFAGGSGTQADPYQISTPAELAFFAKYLEGGALNTATEKIYFSVTAPLDMSAHQWKPIGYTSADANTNTLHNAVLDGGNNLISGLKLTASYAIEGATYANGCALFTKIGTGAVIQNVKLEAKILNPVLTDSTVVAGLVGTVYSSAKVANCEVTVDLDVNGTGGAYYYAGAIGFTRGLKISDTSTYYPTVDGLTVKGDMKVTAPAATVVKAAGVMGNYQAASVKNMTNEAAITVVATSDAMVGGVIADTYSGPVGSGLKNKGTISVTFTAASTNYSYIGGVFGTAAVIRNGLSQVTNEGSVTVTTGDAKVSMGGIIGRINHKETNMIGFTNSGDVKLIKTKAANIALIGGIIGYFDGSASGANMKNVENTGNVTLEVQNGIEQNIWVGGLVAAQKGIALTECTNRGAVTATGINSEIMVGGISGDTQDMAGGLIKNCKNYGTVEVTDFGTYDAREHRHIGGIVGRLNGPTGETVTGCINYGALTYNSVEQGSLGGIVGNLGLAGVIVKNCVNEGTVTVYNVNNTSHRPLGGIVGQMNHGTMTDCTNNGLVWQKNVVQNSNATGGLTGFAVNASIVKNSTNNGEVRLTIDTTMPNSNALYAGGLIGRLEGTAQAIDLVNNGDSNFTVLRGGDNSYLAGGIGKASGNAVLERITNNGTVTISSLDGVNGMGLFIGGVASIVDKVTATELTNNGDVVFEGNRSATLYVGGVLGRAANTSTATYLTNTADITVNKAAGGDAHTGGIIGHTLSSCTLNNLTNTGNITVQNSASSYTGGIFGVVFVGANPKTISDCFNSGSVTATASGNNAVAGICSRTSADQSIFGGQITFKNCINIGEILDGSLSGGMIGYTQACGQSEITDTNDLDKDGNTEETIKVVKGPYTVTLENCIGYGSGMTYSLVGSHRSDNLILINCFGNTEYFLTYYNQNAGVLYSDGSATEVVSINGVDVLGNGVAYNPDTCAHIELETLGKASVRLDSLGTDASGLRFDSYITKASYDELAALTGVEYSFGTMIAPTDNLNLNKVMGAYDKMAALDALTAEGKKMYVLVPYEQEFLGEDADNYYFAAAIGNILEKNYNLKFSAIAYLTIDLGDLVFTAYADYSDGDTERARSVAQVAGLAFEDRATEETTIDGIAYKYPAMAENECYIGKWSPYSNSQLERLKLYSSYDNTGKELPAGLSVNGVSISEYKIVYAQSPIYDTYGSLTGKTLYGDLGNLSMAVYSDKTTATGEYVYYGNALLGAKYDYDYQTAIRIQEAIYNEYGVLLEVVPDVDPGADKAYTADDIVTPESDYEILVGLTNRAKSQSAKIMGQSVDNYTFKIDDTKIIVCGGSYGATWHAVDALEALFAGLEAPDYNLKMAGDLSGSYDLQKIATIGDSITRGSQGLPDGDTFGGPGSATATFGSTTTSIYLEQFLSYPANLQRLMWKDAVVYNFGRGASTVGNYNNPDNYYEGNAQWRNCLTTSNSDEVDFDLVFMMHGTNDAGCNGGAATWDDTKKDFFAAAVQSLIDQILEGSPDAKFVLNNAPHAFDGTGFGRNENNDRAIREAQLYTAQKLAAMEEYEGIIYHYDMNSYTKENLCVGSCGTCENYEDVTAGFDSSSEKTAHGYYYNVDTPYTANEGTHPNFRGYNKIAAGIYDVVNYILNGAEAPTYMIDVTAE